MTTNTQGDCPTCGSTSTGCAAKRLNSGRRCCSVCSGDHEAKPRARWLRRKKRNEAKPETTPDLPNDDDAELPFGIW